MSRYDNIGIRRNGQGAILRRMHIYRDYPFVCISAAALVILESAGAAVSQSIRESIPVVLKALECYLAVTGQKLDATTTGRIRLGRVRTGFLGAIYSAKFLSATIVKRHQYANIWAKIANAVSVEFGLAVRTLPVSWSGVHPKLLMAVHEFDRVTLVSDQVTLWQGWPVVNQNGKWSWIPLRPVFHVHGAVFTARLYAACDLYFSTRRAESVPLITHLINFLSSEWPPEAGDFSVPAISSDFFKKFLLYVVAFMKDSNQYSVVRDRWVAFVGFASENLCGSNLFAKPDAGFTHLPSVSRSTNVKQNKNGKLVNTKLLLDVPLQLTDQEALEILTKTLDAEIFIIEKWAESRAAEVWANRERRIVAAKIGTPRIYDEEHGKFVGDRSLTHRSNPQWYENCAATFEQMGFRPLAGEPFERGLYPFPLSDLAYQLGLPTTGCLVPHLAILVANHTELTPSLLEKLELYDRAGHDCLVQQIGGTKIFSGIKLRRGANLAEQTVALNEKTAAIVEQVIELTRPLREYLKAAGDSAWRLLFLSSGQGFAYPRPIKISDLTSSRLRLEHIAEKMSEICGLSTDVAEEAARRFSLPRLRASVAVSGYIKKPDIGTLARNLGHANVDVKLLRSYLPEALLDFFQERWIRLFQCGLLCEALKGSKWRLPATGFHSEAELDKFMMNHRLKLKPAATQTVVEEPSRGELKNSSDEDDEVLFSIDVEVLTVLLSLVVAYRATPNAMTVTGTYWATFGEHVISEIRDSKVPREDLQAMLKQAEVAAKSIDLGEGAYV